MSYKSQLPKNSNFIRLSSLKKYYQTIIECFGSLKFTHRSNSREESIEYSKAQILKIFSLGGWGVNPYFDKILLGYLANPKFSYYGYHNA
uniref:Uncharacterized protein n=1 Tax=Lactuca sativa TaxID=4236 RepID=A0A9R1VY93_LACSA|nr:hypothetical protein LSAT_V11C400169610 [Lactuca sativa]